MTHLLLWHQASTGLWKHQAVTFMNPKSVCEGTRIFENSFPHYLLNRGHLMLLPLQEWQEELQLSSVTKHGARDGTEILLAQHSYRDDTHSLL